MADREGIELARVGEFDLAIGGKQEFTAPMLIDAARRAQQQGDKFRAPLKLGHTDPRNDGEPAFGWLHNLRVAGEGDDAVLLGDVTGMPDWLAANPSAYPDRSIEGNVIPGADGSKGLEINALALLGVSPPAMASLKTWRELPGFIAAASGLSVTSFAAAYQALRDTPIQAVTSSKTWADYTEADYTLEQWRRACLIKIAAASPNKDDYKLPVREPSGAVNPNGVHAAASVLSGGVQAPDAAKKAAALALVGLYRTELQETPPASLLALAGVASTPEPPAPPVIPNPKEADTMSDTLLQGLRERLGASAEVDEAGLLAAFDAKLAESAQAVAAAAAPKLPEGSTVISKDALDELRIAAAAGAEARAHQLSAERDDTIRTAIAAGKVAPARKEHWTTAWDKDPEGVKASLAELEVIFPVSASGRPGGDDLGADEPFSDDEAAAMAELIGAPKEAFLK